MNGFTEAALRNGAEIQFDTYATAINTKNEKIVSVETNKGIVECENVVLCTGAWAKELAATANIDLPVSPQRRQIVWAKAKEPLPKGLPMVIDIGSGFHFRPAKDWRESIARAKAGIKGTSDNAGTNREVLFAFPDPDEPSSTDRSFDEAFIGKVYERAKHRAPYPL